MIVVSPVYNVHYSEFNYQLKTKNIEIVNFYFLLRINNLKQILKKKIPY